MIIYSQHAILYKFITWADHLVVLEKRLGEGRVLLTLVVSTNFSQNVGVHAVRERYKFPELTECRKIRQKRSSLCHGVPR